MFLLEVSFKYECHFNIPLTAEVILRQCHGLETWFFLFAILISILWYQHFIKEQKEKVFKLRSPVHELSTTPWWLCSIWKHKQRTSFGNFKDWTFSCSYDQLLTMANYYGISHNKRNYKDSKQKTSQPSYTEYINSLHAGYFCFHFFCRPTGCWFLWKIKFLKILLRIT